MRPKKPRKRQSNYSFARQAVRRHKGKTMEEKLDSFRRKDIRLAIARREIGKAIRESGLRDKKVIANLMGLIGNIDRLPKTLVPFR